MTDSENHSGGNQTITKVFILVGFSYLNKLQILLFVVCLLTYLLSLMGNLLIILLIKLNPSLHTPMYFFLVNLSFLEICCTTSVTPQLLAHLLVEEKTITLEGCTAQLYVFSITGLTACSLLAVMAYDRYVAICRPLHYTTIMSGWVCVLLASSSWFIGILVAGAQTMWLFSQPFCGSNHIHHYFCSSPPLQKMLCTNMWNNTLLGILLLVLFVLGPFLLIILSYIHIISTILKLPSTEGRRKAFSTCSSHLTVVTLLYGTALLGNLKATSNSNLESDQFMSFIHTVVTPLLNPIIYTLRNKEVKGALRNTVAKVIFSHNQRFREWKVELIETL
ncbi:olfactory receptor 10A4-like [Carettochelys insculpta]|uniref:olfactory receptor 10A4-like n=1 Tax=Carettochelys insculpta TaxID=44489 RepID=UPI003EB6CF8F